MEIENQINVMTIEKLQLKLENQQKLIHELTNENEQLYQQYNHLIVRNNKLLKRIDDMQQIVNDLHVRIEESQLINDNLLKINDNLKNEPNSASPENNNTRGMIDNLQRRIDELYLRNNSYPQPLSVVKTDDSNALGIKSEIDLDRLFNRWKKYPGQDAKNTPNLRKQSQMLAILYENKSMRAADLFAKTGVNGVTGARYVSTLKKFNLIEYKGARKKGHYVITQKGIDLIKNETDDDTDLMRN